MCVGSSDILALCTDGWMSCEVTDVRDSCSEMSIDVVSCCRSSVFVGSHSCESGV